ncbi:ABC transporter substrate-binding protein [Photobacterium sp.]|uniref:ABC transporter substrate-binding protein n=1 Tax=Photobacterium sp. TaxID=660 RepID=UPI00299E776A|nr:ABC transporter substrate-binding protein [Photobacterium sp.]MDX1301776.1 ABC transporter substrate-binding protein [Photobacterium sp.]
MRSITVLMLLLFTCTALAEREVEFLHWWTSKGEAAAFNIVKKALNEKDIKVVSFPVQGGGGDRAMSILQARAIAGNLPDIAQLEGRSLQSWAALGFLQSLNTIAAKHEWNKTLLPLAQEIHRYQDHYVAIPITIHRLNWMWVNHDILSQYQLSVPTTWDQAITVFRELKRRNIPPLAMGSEPWQVVQLFENIAFGYGGAEYYRKAFIDLEPSYLNSEITVEVLDKFRKISEIVLPDMTSIGWDTATRELLDGKRAFQISGDWTLGELIAQGGSVPEKIGCFPTPGKHSGFIYNMDSFAIFDGPLLDDDSSYALAKTLAEPEFLRQFNQVKGSIPARNDILLEGFNACALQSQQDFNLASQQNTMIPSIIDSMAVSPLIQKAVSSELFRFFNEPSMKAEQVILHLQSIPKSGILME